MRPLLPCMRLQVSATLKSGLQTGFLTCLVEAQGDDVGVQHGGVERSDE